MKITKKVFALILALLLIGTMTLLPLSATAPESDAPADETIGEESSDVQAPEEEDKEEAPGITFQPKKFIESLKYMGTGMIGIFLVIAIIIVATVILNRVFSGKAKE